MSSIEPKRQWVEIGGSEHVRLATEAVGKGPPFLWGHSLLGSMAQDLDGGVLAWPGDKTHPLEVAEELCRTIPGVELEVTNRTAGPYGWSQRVREFLTSLD